MRTQDQFAVPYNKKFYDDQADGSLRSARVVVPLVIDLVEPGSVVDFGCGIGTWLQAFMECGIDNYLGLDGDYVDRARLRIPEGKFRPMDLTCPTPLGRRFDLAVCLEVGEHLPRTTAQRLVQALTEAAPAVLFSAALPGQGGTNHINEQWSWYWEELFARLSFVRVDLIRPRIWQNPDVKWWYQQNTYLYVNQADFDKHPKLSAEYSLSEVHPMELVSADILRQNIAPPPLRRLIAMLPKAAWRALSRRMWYRPRGHSIGLGRGRALGL